MEDITRIDALAARAWPAAEAVEADGWLLRSTPRLDRWRNTSALPLALDAPLEPMEAFYAARGQRPIVQVGPAECLGALDAALERLGYERRIPVDVLTVEADGVECALPDGGPAIAARAEPTDDWIAAWTAGEGRTDVAEHHVVFDQLAGRATYLLAEEGAGTALTVTEDGWTGVFCMAVAPEHRRLGVATALMRAAAAFAPRLYLQVSEENAAAHALYRRSGFTRAYGYHYRIAPS